MGLKKELEHMGHDVTVPKNVHLYADGTFKPETRQESTENKRKDNLIRNYFNLIDRSEAILVVNKYKNNIENYIGGNTFLEIGFAHVLNKKIFLLNPVPNMPYSDEILAMEPIVINGNLSKIN